MMMAAEFLGEALGVSPEREYAFGDFLQELLRAAKEARQRPVDWENWSDLRTLGEELQKLDRAFVVLLIRERIDSVLSGGGQPGRIFVRSGLLEGTGSRNLPVFYRTA